MKKLFTLSFLLIFSMIVVNAQSNLFKGITSGMSETEFYTHCEQHPDMEIVVSDGYQFIKTVIEGRYYIMFNHQNSKNQLMSVEFWCADTYTWLDYDPNIISIAVELFNLLEVKYGEPVYDSWLDWTEIPDGKNSVVVRFEKNNLVAMISVAEDNDDYMVRLIVGDSNFTEKKPKSSGGF